MAPVIRSDDPEKSLFQASATGIERWRRGFVHEKEIGGSEATRHVIGEWLQMKAGAASRGAQRRPTRGDRVATGKGRDAARGAELCGKASNFPRARRMAGILSW